MRGTAAWGTVIMVLAGLVLGGCALGGDPAEATAADTAPTTTEPDAWTAFTTPLNAYCLAEIPKIDGRSLSTPEFSQEWLDIYAGVVEGLVFTMGSLPAPPGEGLAVRAAMGNMTALAQMSRAAITGGFDPAVADQRLAQMAADIRHFDLVACDFP